MLKALYLSQTSRNSMESKGTLAETGIINNNYKGKIVVLIRNYIDKAIKV